MTSNCLVDRRPTHRRISQEFVDSLNFVFSLKRFTQLGGFECQNVTDKSKNSIDSSPTGGTLVNST